MLYVCLLIFSTMNLAGHGANVPLYIGMAVISIVPISFGSGRYRSGGEFFLVVALMFAAVDFVWGRMMTVR